jgi:hypothetical protein
MNTKEKTARFEKILAEQDIANFESNLTRARSVNIGTCFNGVTEISMRGSNGSFLWAPVQQSEVVEIIYQMAASIGCHINIQPRNDFSSWREWRVTEQEKLHLNGHPPFVNDMAPHMAVGANLPPPEQQPGLQPALMAKEIQDEQAVAIEKTLKRRSTKRTAKTT